ncbi:MAG TPA: PKD domain-containing protein [Bacteroidia bacterium]|nr:PKD domain-containing protein [Bacteroidia bacterium]
MNPYSIFLLFSIVVLSACKKDTGNDSEIKNDPAVDFISSTGDGFAPDTIQFTNQSSGADGYQWDFSDGSSSSETNPAHIFQNAGTYNVKLTGTNAGGFAYIIKPVNVEPDTELTSSRNYVLAESIFANVFALVEEAASGCSSGLLNSCGNVTNDTVAVPHILKIDFGAVNCACADQKPRRGKIIVAYTGLYSDSGNVHQISFENFYESNNRVTGNISCTNNGHNSSNHLNYSLTLNTKLFLPNSADPIIWNAQRTIEWMQGESTYANCNDDVYKMAGSATGILFRGKSFSSTITTAVQKQILCPPLVIGKITLTPQGKANRTLNFGNGLCDLTVTVSLNGKETNIPAY